MERRRTFRNFSASSFIWALLDKEWLCWGMETECSKRLSEAGCNTADKEAGNRTQGCMGRS